MTFKEWYEFNKDIFIAHIEKFAFYIKDKDSGNMVFEGHVFNNDMGLLLELFGKYEMLECTIDYSNYYALIITLSNKVKE